MSNDGAISPQDVRLPDEAVQINDLDKLKLMIVEMTKALGRIDSEREHIKATATEIAKRFGIKAKISNKIAKTLYKKTYADTVAEEEEFRKLYKTLVGNVEAYDE